VIAALVARTRLPISVDTSKPAVARRALDAGATMVNDVHALSAPGMSELVAERGCAAVLMHNRAEAVYAQVVDEVIADLETLVRTAETAGVNRARMIVDPGFGFGKTARQNLELLRRLHDLRRLELPVLSGTSRKSTIGKVLDLPVEERLEGTAATVALAIAGGADIVRVHDVRAMARVARMTDAVVRRPPDHLPD
jgi:dihydropteroate synthase